MTVRGNLSTTMQGLLTSKVCSLICGRRASRASEARRQRMGIYTQQCKFIHPMKGTLLYCVIADQSNLSLLKLHTKAELACTWGLDDFHGPCMVL